MTQIVSAATLDLVVRNSLAVRLGDRSLAAEIYSDLQQQILHNPDRLHDLDISAALAPWHAGPATGRGAMFIATIRWEYRVVPTQQILRFACVPDRAQHRELVRDPASTLVHCLGSHTSVPADEAFELVHVAVDGRQRPARRTSRNGAHIYTVNLGQDIDGRNPVSLTYTYRVLVQRHGHLLHLDLARPTRGLKVRLAYGNCGINHVNVLDYIASAQQPRITRSKASDPSPTVELTFDGWALPKTGIAFVWTLSTEVPHTTLDQPSNQSQLNLPNGTSSSHTRTKDRREFTERRSVGPK